MIQPDSAGRENKYHVRVGHTQTTVVCGTPDEAIRLARQRLSEEMPRLWDVIHRIADKDFRVDLMS